MKAKIVIASTLKPVIDPRAYEKIGRSLANHGGYEVYILGSLPTKKEVSSLLSLYPMVITRGVLRRIISPWKILRQLQKIKPEVLIITTHELLFIGVIFKIINGKKLIYDVQENYFYNLFYQNNYSWGLRHLLAFYIRLKEIILARFVNHFLLAEQCYADEISFIKQRYTVLENKFKAPEITLKKQNQNEVEFLVSGTISKAYGVFEALHFFKQLPPAEYRLIIVGHCPHKQTLNALKKEASGSKNIDLIVSAAPVPHDDILAQIGDKTIGLLPYQINKSTENKIPTKLYEYIGLGIPVLISPNPLWGKLVKSYQAGLSIDFHSAIDIDKLSISLTSITNNQLIDLKDIMWVNEENKLLAIFNKWFL